MTSEYTKWYDFSMLKKVLLFLSLFFILPVFAGEFEEASISNKKMFVYLYIPECSYCDQFSPIYDKLAKKYDRNCKFLKINANTQYGSTVAFKLLAPYYPYVVLLDNQKQTMQRVIPPCLINEVCAKDAVEKFVN